MIQCAFCKAPIVLDPNRLKGTESIYIHEGQFPMSHTALPNPDGVRFAPLLVFSALTMTTAADFIRTLRKSVEWAGPYTVTVGDKDQFIITLAVHPDNVAYVSAEARRQSLFYGPVAKATRLKAEDYQKGGIEMPKTEKAAAAPAEAAEKKPSQFADWWQCPSCKRHIKSGAEKHYAKYADCLATANAPKAAPAKAAPKGK